MAKIGNKSSRRSEKKSVMEDHLKCNQKQYQILNAYHWSLAPNQRQSAATTANQEISFVFSARALAVTRVHYSESTKAMTCDSPSKQ